MSYVRTSRMATTLGARGLLRCVVRTNGTQPRPFSASCRRRQADAGPDPRTSGGTFARTSSQSNGWSARGVVAIAVVAAAVSWTAAWTLQRKEPKPAGKQLLQYDVEPRYATMDEMKEVSSYFYLGTLTQTDCLIQVRPSP